MEKIDSWLWLVVAIVWLLPLLKVNSLGIAGDWIIGLAIGAIAVLGLTNK